MPSPYEINPEITFDVEYIGNQKTPIVIIDNFLIDTAQLIGNACDKGDFQRAESTMYPGVRALLPRDYAIAAIQAVGRKLYEVYQIPITKRLAPMGLNYSLVSLAATELSPIQRIPHFDSVTPNYFALLHYLSPAEHGGTGFFRHRSTNFENVTEATMQQYISIVEEQLSSVDSNYFVQSDEYFELYHQIDYQPNRMVFYPGNLLHSGLINPSTDICDDPQKGRLTANLFVEFK